MSNSSSLMQAISLIIFIHTITKCTTNQYFYSNDFTSNMLIELEIGTVNTKLLITYESERPNVWLSIALNATSHLSNRFGIIYNPSSTSRIHDVFLSSYDPPTLLHSEWSLDNEINDDDGVIVTLSRPNKISSNPNYVNFNVLKEESIVEAIWAYGTSTAFKAHTERHRGSSILQRESSSSDSSDTDMPTPCSSTECRSRDRECCIDECIWGEFEICRDSDECCLEGFINPSPTEAPICSRTDDCRTRNRECCTGACAWGEFESCRDDECCIKQLTYDPTMRPTFDPTLNPTLVDPCNCENGIGELEVKYGGRHDVDSIVFYSREVMVCSFNAVQKGDILLCDVSEVGSLPDKVYFTIAYDMISTARRYSASADSVDDEVNICSGYFDTSCSKDIVSNGCVDLEVIGWSDVQTHTLCDVQAYLDVESTIEHSGSFNLLQMGLMLIMIGVIIVFFSVYTIIKCWQLMDVWFGDKYRSRIQCNEFEIEGVSMIGDGILEETTLVHV